MTSSTFASHKAYANSRYGRGYGEPMLIQDGFYSPERTPNKDSTKLTPKSILKESTNSGFKPKKTIIINESLNETRKLSLRSESSDRSLEKKSKVLASRGQGPQTRDLRPKTATSSFASHYGAYGEQPEASNQRQRVHQNNRYEQSLRSHAYPENNYSTFENHSSAYGTENNISNASKQNLLDFQIAHIRKLQKEKEQDKYSEIAGKNGINEDFDSARKKNYSMGDYPVATEKNESKRDSDRSRRNENPSVSFYDKNNKSGGKRDGNLDNIEGKIYDLEKNLDSYSKRLRESIERQRSRFAVDKKVSKPKESDETNSISDRKREEPIKRVYEKSGISTATASRARNNESSRKQVHTQASEVNETKPTKETNKNSQARDQPKDKEIERARNSAGFNHTSAVFTKRLDQYNGDRAQYKSHGAEEYLKDLQEEIVHLRNENKYLRTTFQKGNDNNLSLTKPSYKLIAENIFDKEKELLKAVEQIRTKLNNSIANRSIRERLDETSSNETWLKNSERPKSDRKISNKENAMHKVKKNERNVSQSSAVRQAYGPKLLERENSSFLNSGVTTSYSGFHWNADKSLKINRNI